MTGEPAPAPGERLQKVLARAGVASRRGAEAMIRQGRVRVNGQVITELGTRVGGDDRVTVDGQPLPPAEGLQYQALHKPPGYVTTVVDPQGRPTVIDLVRRAGREDVSVRLYPIGRLDRDSEGLLLLTNDGDLALRLMHPRYHQEREYLVQVEGQPAESDLRRLREGGLHLDGRPAAPAEVQVVPGPDRVPSAGGRVWLRFVLREGRKRQIRRLCEAIGHPVIRLLRVRIGAVQLGDLPPGQLRPLTAQEVQALKEASGSAGGQD